jgi:hypothetical protein
MKKLIAIPNNVETSYDLGNDDIIKVNINASDNTFITIAKCGLALEEYLLKDGKHTLYSDPTRYTLAGIIWKTPTDNFVDESMPWLQNIRGDELLFPSLDHRYDSSWVAGNTKALIKWAASCVSLNVPEINPAYRYANKSDQIWLAWLAHRIGLKVYGQI